MRVQLFVAAGLAAAVAACTTMGGAEAPLGPDPAVERGRAFAQLRCSGCHATTLDEKPGSSAPRFRDIRLRHTAISLERRLASIVEQGHYEMPRMDFTSQEARDVAVYIESLGEP
jgi:mono/diheme cytochrome c family protein